VSIAAVQMPMRFMTMGILIALSVKPTPQAMVKQQQ
jgi:hypothetical protein